MEQYSPELNDRLLVFACRSKAYQSLFGSVSEYKGIDYAGEGSPHVNESILTGYFFPYFF